MSDTIASPNAKMIEQWNTATGQTWAVFQAELDAQVAPLGSPALAALDVHAGAQVLDIGCGCGQTALQLADLVGQDRHVVGVDISKLMLEVARGRAGLAGLSNITFLEADAQTYDLGRQRFDAVFSRFGVMFFADPVAAFSNISKAMKSGGRLAFVCWRPLSLNDWMRLPLETAMTFLPPSPPSDPLAPGPFAFADAERVRSILTDAGFTHIETRPFDTPISMGDLATATRVALQVGPLGRLLRENPAVIPDVTEAIGTLLKNHVTEDGTVQMPASVWIVTASA